MVLPNFHFLTFMMIPIGSLYRHFADLLSVKIMIYIKFMVLK
ncbi:hypothetical protein HMPREF3034_02011 [Prevotella sp. DNF00663]|nr:hypothetical protein HMPREF3034_02011 [Prevotella sp. DNF00663]